MAQYARMRLYPTMKVAKKRGTFVRTGVTKRKHGGIGTDTTSAVYGN